MALMTITARGTVFDARSAPAHRRFNIMTSPLVLADGRWLVAFRTGSSKDSADENILIRLSADEGATWETVCEGLPSTLDGVPGGWRAGSMSEPEPGLILGCFCWFDRSDPGAPLAHPETQGVLPSRIFLLESRDAGRTWKDMREVEPGPYAGMNEGLATTGPLFKLHDGRLAVQYESWKAYHDPSPGKHHAIIRLSDDGARTFGPPIVTAHDPAGTLFFWDQRLEVDPETGRLVGLFWTHDRSMGQDRNIHIAWGSPDGATWTPPQDTGIAGQISCPLALPGGRLLAAYVHRHDPPSLRVVLSHDFGITWERDEELIFYESGSGRESGMGGRRDFGDYWSDMYVWSFGHAEARRLPGGEVWIAHYGGDSSAMGIHWVRLAVQS